MEHLWRAEDRQKSTPADYVLFAARLSLLSSQSAKRHRTPPEYVALLGLLVASLLFFGCILLHELAHSLVAGRNGLRVPSITLFLFGGVSNIEHEPPSARAEFFIAVVGPSTSILLGIDSLP